MPNQKAGKIPLGIILISIFYYLFASFYFIFGIFFSGLMFLFGTIMMGNTLLLSNEVLNSLFKIAEIVTPEAFPFMNLIFKGYFISMGILSLEVSVAVFLVVLGLRKGKRWARFSIIGISLFEIILALSLFDLFGIILHVAIHGTIILYLLFSRNARGYFTKTHF